MLVATANNAADPYFSLSRNSGANDKFSMAVRGSSTSSYLSIWDVSNGIMDQGIIVKGNNVGIGTVNPSYNLDVVGSARATGSVAAWSDIRVKKNIVQLTHSLAKILKVNGVNFEWRNDEFPEKKFKKGKDIGVIAQNIETQFPEIVETGSDTYKSVAYQKLVAPLIEAVKEFYGYWFNDSKAIHREIASMKAELASKDKTIKDLEARMAKLEKISKK